LDAGNATPSQIFDSPNSMSRTLLLDLDNTLLRNENSVFIPALIEAFCESASDLIDPGEIPAVFLESTRAMILNTRPDKVLWEVMGEDLSRRSGVERARLEQRIYSFYDEIYRTLKGLTGPINGARELVREAISRGYRIAIATNPIYPLSAIRQRLEWADLSNDWFKPDMITSSERFHFTKPAPAFFSEVMAQMGWPEGEIIAIGDDLQNDIRPAREFGIPAYQAVQGTAEPNADPESSGRGALSDFFDWLDSTPAEVLTPGFDSPEALAAILRATPAAFDTTLRTVSGPALDYRPADAEWNITEVICHLRDVEREVQLPRIKQVLEETNPLIVGKDTDEWANTRGYCFQDPRIAFREFYDSRMETLSWLGSIAPEDWQRPARHTIFGPTTLLELTSIAAEHDRLHVSQAWNLDQDHTRDAGETAAG
jgi:FMN phosphatase YigB (HAD superfamily)